MDCNIKKIKVVIIDAYMFFNQDLIISLFSYINIIGIHTGGLAGGLGGVGGVGDGVLRNFLTFSAIFESLRS